MRATGQVSGLLADQSNRPATESITSTPGIRFAVDGGWAVVESASGDLRHITKKLYSGEPLALAKGLRFDRFDALGDRDSS